MFSGDLNDVSQAASKSEEAEVLKMGFYQQTPGNFPLSGRKCLTGWGAEAVGSSQTS